MSKAKAGLKINWAIADKNWKSIDFDPKKIGNITAKRTFKHMLIPDNTAIEISVLLSNDKALQELNKAYRGKNKPTNVLSFPSGAFEHGKKGKYLGDIAISLQTLYNESLEQQKTLKSHYTHMLVHSILHLIGYDHEKKKEAEIMENLEITILKSLNIKNPYE